ncbi:MAG: hypothetical protein IJH52_01110 [Oscillospiraceae bacterium]|nr:hypothetical protein [Oscillospiraceae bacterium]MBQ6403460.1 hypothetical protein [Oscillospiraceae bacterium]
MKSPRQMFVQVQGTKRQLKSLRSLPVELDLSAPVPVKVDKTLVKKALSKLNTPKTRRIALLGVGAAVAAGVSSTTATYAFHRNIISKELKRQLEPLHEEIAALQKTVDELNEKLEAQQK